MLITARCTTAAFLLLAGHTLAQSNNPLSGPPVKSDRPAHLQDRFSEGGGGDKRGPMNDRGVPIRAYMDIIAKLRAGDTPANLRLSDEQQKKIEAIAEEFRQSVRAYAEKMRDEPGAGPRPAPPREQGAKPGDPQPTPPGGEGKRPNRERAEEFRRNGPKPLDAEVKIWALLTEPQQKFVDGEVQKLRQEMEQRQSEQYVQRRLRQRQPGEPNQPGQPPAAGPGQPPPGDAAAPRERYRRIMERLQQLPPEERDRILQRLEAELDRRAGQTGQPPAPRPDQPAPTPPPRRKNS
jgi:hypothetical protein